MKWEHTLRYFDVPPGLTKLESPGALNKIFDNADAHGWEYVNSFPVGLSVVLVFRRPVIESAPMTKPENLTKPKE